MIFIRENLTFLQALIDQLIASCSILLSFVFVESVLRLVGYHALMLSYAALPWYILIAAIIGSNFIGAYVRFKFPQVFGQPR